MSAQFYRAAASDLDRYAADVDDCDTTHVTPCRQRLPEVLQGAATGWLEDQLSGCSSDLDSAAAILRSAAGSARATAAAIEAAAIAAAAEAAAAAAAAAEEPEPVDPPPQLFW